MSFPIERPRILYSTTPRCGEKQKMFSYLMRGILIPFRLQNKVFVFSKSIYRSLKSLTRAKQSSFTPRWAREVREKKPTIRFAYVIFVRITRFSQPRAIPIGKSSAMFSTVSASLPSHAVRFQPRYRPFVWLLARTSIGKNTICFAVYFALQQCVIYT